MGRQRGTGAGSVQADYRLVVSLFIPMTFRRGFFAVLIILILLISGCTSSHLKEARKTFIEDGDPNTAVEILEKEGDSRGLSNLLFHMEKGLLLHQAGRFEESITTLRNASKLMKNQDYLSISQQTTSMVVNDWMTDYKGEYCERLWVHTYLMINSLLLHQYESALVEAKQALKVFDAYPDALREAYFSMALVGLCYELFNEFNDAYIVYKRLEKMLPDASPICDTLMKTGLLSGIVEPAECKPKEKTNGNQSHLSSWEKGELVLFVSTGFAPVKVAGNIILPPGIRFSFPRYESGSGGTQTITVNNAREHPLPTNRVTTNIMQVASTSLGERAKQIYIKETARVAVKEAIIHQARREDALVGLMTRMAMMAMEEPDTRCWHTLPGENSLLRIPLEPGSYNLSVNIERSGSKRSIDLPLFSIEKRERRFIAVRENGKHISVHVQEFLKDAVE